MPARHGEPIRRPACKTEHPSTVSHGRRGPSATPRGAAMFYRLSKGVPLAVAAFLAFACPAEALVVGGYHILPLPAYYEQFGRVPPGGGDGPLYYYGGSVFSHVKLVSVMWSGDVSDETASNIPMLSAAMVNSTYMDQMAEYGTLHKKAINGHRGTKQEISRGTYLGQVQIAPRNAATQLTDADIQKGIS